MSYDFYDNGEFFLTIIVTIMAMICNDNGNDYGNGDKSEEVDGNYRDYDKYGNDKMMVMIIAMMIKV